MQSSAMCPWALSFIALHLVMASGVGLEGARHTYDLLLLTVGGEALGQDGTVLQEHFSDCLVE